MAVAGVPTVAKKTELETKPVPAVPTVPQKNAGPTPDASPEAKKDGPDGEDNKNENKKAPNANNIDGQTRAMLKIMGLSDEQIEEILGNMPNLSMPETADPFATPKNAKSQTPQAPENAPDNKPETPTNQLTAASPSVSPEVPSPRKPSPIDRDNAVDADFEDQPKDKNKYDAANDEATKAEAEGLGPMKMDKDDTGPKMKDPAPQQATPKRPQPSPSMGG